MIVFVLISLRATCGKPKPLIQKPVQVLKFKDYVYYHNASITFDGRHYYTINGGNEGWCMINEYDINGNYIETYDVELDGRAIFYQPKDGNLYVKVYGTDLYVVDLDDETAEIKYSGIFNEDNSSPAISPDGKYMYELVEGRIRVISFNTGKKVKGLSIDDYYDEHGYYASMAASDYYLFVWTDDDEIAVYDHNGIYITEVDMPREGYGFSLSFCNGLLWFAKDADGSTDGANGYWYGYRL
jgi:sugar lactone lactonase YvrE